MRKVLYILLALVPCVVWGQNATSSPSSRFGLGEMNDNSPGAYRAMGGVTTGMRRNSAINPSQPASYTACDSLSFMFDIGGSVMWTNYSDVTGHKNVANGNLEYVMLQFPIWKQHIAFSAGILPYSTMGYKFSLNVTDQQHPYAVGYAGEGTITQAYGGLSFNLWDWVALGANFYYMFGTVQNITLLSFDETELSSTSMYRMMNVGSWRGRYGMQFFHTWGKHSIVLGGVFESKLPLKGTYLQYELTTLDSVLVSDDCFDVPMVWSAGLSYTFANRATVALDYTMQQWSHVRYFGQTNFLNDRGKWSLGLEYRHDPLSRKYVDRVMWRVGASLSDAYRFAQNNGKKDYTVSLGFGLPLRTTATMINLVVEYTRRESMDNLKENVMKLTIDASINENWFFKRKL